MRDKNGGGCVEVSVSDEQWGQVGMMEGEGGFA